MAASLPSPDQGAEIEGFTVQEIIDAIGFEIYLSEPDDRIVLVNAAAARHLAAIGVDPPAIAGLTRRDVQRLLLQSGYIDQRQFVSLGRSGTALELEMAAGRSVSIRGFADARGRRVAVVMDVSDIRRAEQVRAAEQRQSTTGSLVGGVAHEFSTPLGVALTGASFVRDKVDRVRAGLRTGTLTPDGIERALGEVGNAVALVLSNLDRAVELVQTLTLLTAEPAGDTRQRISIRRHVGGIVEALGSQAAVRGHALLVDCPTDLEVETSPGALTQVLANLVMNSLHHAFGNRPGGTVLVSVTRHDGQVRIVVGDDGIGIDPEVLPRIFDPFYTTRRGQGGRGLGLAIVHALVTSRLGGFITTEGGPGEGLRQIVAIPVR